MLTTRTTSWILAITGTLLLAGSAQAQRFSPFIEPDYFNPDMQFFAPAEIQDFGGPPEPNTGFFFTYDRAYINVTRPESRTPGNFTAPFDGDFTWGNRFDMGFMTDEDRGWSITTWNIGGPNVTDKDRFFDEVGRFFGGNYNAMNPPLGLVTTVFGGLDREFNMSLGGFELNKVHRHRPLHKGGNLESFIGIRWAKIDDRGLDFSPAFDAMGVQTGDLLYRQRAENNMIGGQLGFRWFKQHGRWVLSTDGRVFAAANFQFMHLEVIEVDTGAASGLVNQIHFDNSEFVPMGELRMEAAYELTRDVAFRFGLEFMHWGRGVSRVDMAPSEFQPSPIFDQDVTMVGLTFGITANR
jgi:hypothetical protein